MAEILPIRRKTPNNQSINQSTNQKYWLMDINEYDNCNVEFYDTFINDIDYTLP